MQGLKPLARHHVWMGMTIKFGFVWTGLQFDLMIISVTRDQGK